MAMAFWFFRTGWQHITRSKPPRFPRALLVQTLGGFFIHRISPIFNLHVGRPLSLKNHVALSKCHTFSVGIQYKRDWH